MRGAPTMWKSVVGAFARSLFTRLMSASRPRLWPGNFGASTDVRVEGPSGLCPDSEATGLRGVRPGPGERSAPLLRGANDSEADAHRIFPRKGVPHEASSLGGASCARVDPKGAHYGHRLRSRSGFLCASILVCLYREETKDGEARRRRTHILASLSNAVHMWICV